MLAARDMQALDEALAEGAVLLVPNFPASMQLRDELAAWRREHGAAAVQPTPAVEAIDLWLRKLWQQLALQHDDERLGLSLLESDQEILLWRRIINDSAFSAGLLNPEGTAREAREAWNLALQWQLPLDFVRRMPAEVTEPEGCDFFGDWAWQFRRLCADIGALSLSQMLQHLLSFCREQGDRVRPLLPHKLLLLGFSEPPPLYEALLSAMEALGCTVAALQTSPCRPEREQRVCQQAGDELRAAARWAAAVLRDDTRAQVGIICPNLQALQPVLASVLRQEFAALPAGSWQVLRQRRLDAEPFVQTALRLLDLYAAEMDTLELCALLRSPWLVAAEQEADARSKLEFALRDRGEIVTGMLHFRELCGSERDGLAAPSLAAPLQQLASRMLRLPQKQAFSAWMEPILACWQALLDDDALCRMGQQSCRRAWQSFLERLGEVDWLQPPCSLAEAIAAVRCLAAARTVPSAAVSASVVLLSPLASAGLRFSHLWCLQTDERHWPAENKASAWLPLEAQRSRGMPGSDPALALASAARQFRQLQDSTSAQFIASWSQVEDDCQLRPSPLLASMPLQRLPAAPVPAGLHPRLAELPLAACERITDALPLPLPTPQPFHGDAALPAHQAACPFRAFALYRLRAKRLATPRLGLPPAAIGSILHRMMELFWNRLGSSHALEASDPDTLLQHIEDCAASALARTARHYPATLRPRLRAMEQRRLVDLLRQWLPQEQQRGAFTVLASEHECHWQHGQLQLRFRIDRIDRDDAGGLVVVDYKSGKLPRVHWEDERQDEPQLLLYLQALEQSGHYVEPVAALLYARIHVEEPGYSGIGAGTGICPGIDFATEHKLAATQWQELKDHWQAATRLLADEFLQGNASVQPLRRDTCNYCHLQGLCRIGERGLPTDEDDTGDTDAA